MVAKHVNRENGILVDRILFLSLAALAATFQCCASVSCLLVFIDAKPLPKAASSLLR